MRRAESFRGEGLSSPGISYLAIANVVLSTDLLSWFSEHMKIRGHQEINMRYHVLKNISVCDPLRTPPNAEEKETLHFWLSGEP